MKKLIEDHKNGKHFMQLEVLKKEKAAAAKTNKKVKDLESEDEDDEEEVNYAKNKTPKKRGPKGMN